MPRQTRETALPKAPPPPIDWEKIARSGRVWEFIEGDDFTGKASSFRAREDRGAKIGVDFESAEEAARRADRAEGPGFHGRATRGRAGRAAGGAGRGGCARRRRCRRGCRAPRTS